MGTAGSRKQTWVLEDGTRSGEFTRDRSGDYIPFWQDPVSLATPSQAIKPKAPVGALSYAPVGALSYAPVGALSYALPSGSSSASTALGRKLTDEELASIVARDSDATYDSQFYTGGFGLPNWGVNAAKTGFSFLGALNGVPTPVTKVANAVLGPVLSEEGINEHTLANSAIDAGLSLNPVTGLLNMGGKAIAGLLGKKFDIANAIGEATGTYSLRSPESLNLELFANDSDSAFGGFNQRTLAEIARQEAINAEEHAQRRAQETQLQAALEAEQAAKATSPLAQLQKQALVNTGNSSNSGGSWNGNSYGGGNHSFTGGSSGGSYYASPSYGGYSPTMNYSNSSGGYTGSSW